MPERPIIIIDFDRVLFDTDSYNLGAAEAVAAVGVSQEVWDRITSRYKGEPVSPRDFQAALAEESGADEEAIAEALAAEMEDAVWYLYPDARPFLTELKNRADVYLLTFGDETHQRQKISATGIGDFFEDVIITNEPKHESKKLPIPSVGRAIFLNDHLEEVRELGRIYRWSYHLHVNRAGADLPANFPFASFRSLSEALPTVLGLVDSQSAGQAANPVAD